MATPAWIIDGNSNDGCRRQRQRTWCTTAAALYAMMAFSMLDLATASTGSIYKVTNATSKELPFNDETVLICEMTVMPDRYQWRFYPLGREHASDQDAPLDLSRTNFKYLTPDTHRNERKRSTLTVKMTDATAAGDYQCLAHYGALVIASVPDRITLARMEGFPRQNNSYLSVAAGNTILWKCESPASNPPAYIDYYRNGLTVAQHAEPRRTSMIVANAQPSDSGVYKCRATNAYLEKDGKRDSNFSLNLQVSARPSTEIPRFWPPPKKSYTVTRGEAIFLECNGVGWPVPAMTWTKANARIPSERLRIMPGGLHIVNVSAHDAGVYQCEAANQLGRTVERIVLVYQEPPHVLHGPASKTVKEGENVELSCTITGIPTPTITWLLNGNTVHQDPQIEVRGEHINFKSFEKRHGGQIQCFATNVVGTTYAGGELNVYPKQVSSPDPTGMPVAQTNHATTKKGRKHGSKKPTKKPGSSEMIPPNKPTVSRSNDESVVVRWTVPNNSGLRITFFKVQYRELGPANSSAGPPTGRANRWKTNNSDIAPNIRSFEVTGLKPDYFYKFRIAAVYSNNDNKLSPKSDRFHLKREGFYTKNPLPVPVIIHKSAVNTTSIKIYWNYTSNPNVTIDGFLISYMSASSAADYMKATADGENAVSYVITHLAPDTVYDVKMQSYNTKSASDFSAIVKCKTHKLPTEAPPTTTIKTKDTADNETSVYLFIGLGVGSVALVLSVIICFITCKWKQNKEADKARGERSDKPAVEEINHHIQAEPNDFDYVVTPKSRSNGCALPGNRITITANPLADADNKSQNMIEMSCLSNNNCPTPSASTDDTNHEEGGVGGGGGGGNNGTSTSPVGAMCNGTASKSVGKHKRTRDREREHHRRRKHHNLEGPQGPPPIENYV